MIKLIRRFFRLASAYGGRVKVAFVFSFLRSLLSKAPIALAFFSLIGFYEGTTDVQLCINLGVAMAVCLALQALCAYASDRLQASAGYLIMADKRMELGAHLRRMPMGYFTEGTIGKISSVLSTDMVFIEETVTTAIADLMGYMFTQAIMLIMLAWVSPWLALLALVILLAIIAMARHARTSALADSATRQEQSEKLTNSVIDYLEGMPIIKAYNLLGAQSAELRKNFDRSCEENIAFEHHQTTWERLLYLLYAIGAVAILVAAIALQDAGLMAGPFAVGLMLFVFDVFAPIKALNSDTTRLTVMNSCLDRIEDVMRQAELPDEGAQHLPSESAGGTPEIEFKNVSFSYGDNEVLHDVSFAQNPGTMYALVGRSGSGKSTMANLLARFWDTSGGSVLVRGLDVRDVPLAELMDNISMVFQQVYLFQDTVYNNILMGRPDATREEVEAAARKACCHEFINRLPDGYDTVVGEGGATLSGGERQRISIARCILKDAPIVILDEATASVDVDNEGAIQQAIGELCAGKTLLVIAHRLNTIRSADRILVIDGGRITQGGTHGELTAAAGIYRDMVEVQGKNASWLGR
ncbi:ABC transporter ATP-binding protein [Curtanaerobium respiraculi]|uniref:ABC transporter ATP-binding protein n=1 Tax=Curtanaerobium respiraculi TaxID=2949669 RepID=UPI0024B32C9C|nr:ABC transporter ATP-binding protein [Curtanaerobium respiraculi]